MWSGRILDIKDKLYEITKIECEKLMEKLKFVYSEA
jgi:hypothetical protein